MVRLSAPSAFDATAIPSKAVASESSAPAGNAQAGQTEPAPSAFHQTYNDAVNEGMPRDSKGASKKASGNDNSASGTNSAAAIVAPAPAVAAQVTASLTLTPSLGPKGEAAKSSELDATTEATDKNSGRDKKSEAANQPRPPAFANVMLAGLTHFLEIPPRAAEKAQTDTSGPQTTLPVKASTERPSPQAALAPRVEPLAFSMQLHNNEARTSSTAPTARTSDATTSESEAATREIKPADAPGANEHSSRDSGQDDDTKTLHSESAPASDTAAATREIAVPPPIHDGTTAAVSPRQAAIVTAPRPTEPVAPEPPRADASSPILLKVSGPDQSTASVRVADRGGAVSVQVHASDPELRDSLRSNLGDLASQLNSHGWKTDTAKPVVATHSENNTNSQPNGQRSFNQRDQGAQSDRQSQRDRRSNSDRWVDEFEQQATSAASYRGGK